MFILQRNMVCSTCSWETVSTGTWSSLESTSATPLYCIHLVRRHQFFNINTSGEKSPDVSKFFLRKSTFAFTFFLWEKQYQSSSFWLIASGMGSAILIILKGIPKIHIYGDRPFRENIEVKGKFLLYVLHRSFLIMKTAHLTNVYEGDDIPLAFNERPRAASPDFSKGF